MKAWYERYLEEVWNAPDLALGVEKYWAEDFASHYAEDVAPGAESYRRHALSLFHAFSHLHYTVDDVVVDGDQLVVRMTVTGVHSGEFMNIAATGKEVTFHEIAWYRIADRRFTDIWAVLELPGLLRQLGVRPKPD
jgi:predicted ester cyclase